MMNAISANNNIAGLERLSAALTALFGLYLTSQYSYLLFHSLSEMFSIVIAFGTFVVAWNSRRLIENSYLSFMGIAFLFIGVLDMIHMLAYKGMGVFTGFDANLPTQLWIAARYMQAVSFLLAPLLIGRKLNHRLAFACCGIVTAAVLYSILAARIFPACYIEGTGLTPFKKFSEYVISLLLAASAVLLLRRRGLFEQSTLRLLILSIIATIVSELAFTFYIGVYDFSNLVGHILKIVAFYLIYLAIIRTGIEKPQSLIFRELRLSEEALEKQVVERTVELKHSSELLTGIFERITDAFVALDTVWRYTYVNRKAAEIFGRMPEDLVGKHIWTEFPEGIGQPFYQAYHRAMREQTAIFLEEYYSPYDRWFENRIYPSQDGLSIYFTDITERKKMEIALRESERYNRTLFESSVIGLALCRMDGSLVDINEAYAKIIGRTVEETLNLTYWDITPEKYADQEARQLEYLKTTGSYGPYEKEYIHRDGHLVPVRLQGLLIERGGERFIWSCVEDVTERKRAEHELQLLALELENRIRERTAELEAKVAEIERMNKLFVGRELRIVELKGKIKELEAGCNGYFEKPIEPTTIVDKIHEIIGLVEQ